MDRKITKVIVIFIIIMCLLTIISKKLYIYSKAEVQLTNASSGTLDYSVTGEGKIEKGEHVLIDVPESQIIQEIYVAVGEKVSNGTALISLNTEKLSEDIALLKNELEKLDLERKTHLEQQKVSEENWQTTLSQAQENYNIAIQSEDEEEVKQALQQLEQASVPLATDYQNEIYSIDIAQKESDIKQLQDLLDNDGIIYSPQDGIVISINYKIGEAAMEQSALVLASLKSSTKLKASLTEEEKELIETGSSITVQGINNNNEAVISEDAQVEAVSYVEEDDSYEMTVNLGTKTYKYDSIATFYYENKSKQYSCILPISTLREDTNGYYVLTISEENTILGTELTAHKIYVDVIEKNSTAAAISDGTLNKNQDIIAETNKPIDHGSRVKIKEE